MNGCSLIRYHSKRGEMTMFSRKERDRQLRRADIYKAAEHIFAIKGYHKATIRDIAKQAQYAIGTVYLYFKDKDALYLSLFEEKMKGLLSVVEGKMSAAKDAKRRLEIFIRELLAYFEENLDFFRIFVSEADRLLVEVRLRKTPIGRSLEECLTGIIKQAQNEKIISKDFDPDQVVDVFINIMKTVVLDWFKSPRREKVSLVSQSDLILRYLLKGTSNG